MPWPVSFCLVSFAFLTIRLIASSQDARSSLPFFRIIGYFRRSSERIETQLGPAVSAKRTLDILAWSSCNIRVQAFRPKSSMIDYVSSAQDHSHKSAPQDPPLSVARPRTPTILPSFTPISMPHPLLYTYF